MRKSLWIVLSLLLISLSAPVAHADSVTNFNASGDFMDGTVMSGTITIDTTTGVVTATDLFLTLGPFGPFTLTTQGSDLSAYAIVATDSLTNVLNIDLPVASLVGYEGGAIQPAGTTITVLSLGLFQSQQIDLSSGQLTAIPSPEPSSIALMLLGIALLFATRKRIAPGLSRPNNRAAA